MSLFSEFVLYAMTFRLAIIAAGIVSIVLGYRLFTIGTQTGGGGPQGTTFDASLVGSKFALTNAAPGTFFALFGVILISVMLAQGNPQLNLKDLSESEQGANATGVTLRGSAPTKLEDAVQKGLEFDKNKDTANAVASYEEALTLQATPMNQLAWDYLQQGKAEAALPLARLAVQLCPDKAPFLDTLAEILLKLGERDEALKWMTKAAALDPKYQAKLTELQHPVK